MGLSNRAVRHVGRPPHMGGVLPCVQVHEQGEMAMRIDENVDDTLANVDAGQTQLLKYLNAISGNRLLALKVLGVVLLFLMFFIVFIA